MTDLRDSPVGSLDRPDAAAGSISGTPGRLSAGDFARRLWDRLDADDVLTGAAALSYYFLFSLFPALLFLTVLLGLLPVPGLMDRLLGYFEQLLPGDTASLVRRTLAQTLSGANTRLLSLAVIGAIWAASSGMASFINALSVAYRVTDPRPWWKRQLVAIALTIGLGAFTLTALALVIFGERIGGAVARAVSLGPAFTVAWTVLQWPVVIVCVLVGVLLVYHLAPADPQPLRWLAPGSAFAVTAWLLVSLGLRVYVRNFGSYDATYGSIGGVILLMLWFYLSSLTLLVGAEINAVIREAAAGQDAPRSDRPDEA